MATRIRITRADRKASLRGSTAQCLIATAAQRTHGGEWTVTGAGAVQHIGKKTVRYRHTLSSRLVMRSYDMKLPFRPSTVTLVPVRSLIPPKAGRVAVAAGGGTVAWLIIAGWLWLVLLIAALAGAVFIGVVLLMRRGYTKTGMPSVQSSQRTAAARPQWPEDAGWRATPAAGAATPAPVRETPPAAG